MKYYLQPTWDIIPKKNGTWLVDLQTNQTIKTETPASFFYALSKGATFEELHSYTAQSVKQREQQLKELITIGAVINKIDYLELLKQSVVGPDKIIRQIRSYTLPAENPFTDQIHIARSLGFGPRFIMHQSSLNEGWGADTDPKLAGIKAIVEGIERYALGDYDTGTLIEAPWESVSAKSMTPRQLNTTNQALSAAKSFHWRRLEGLNTDAHILVPLDFNYHPVDYHALQRYPVCPMDISGMAAHQSREAALISAILELCEHEALMVTWFGKRTTPIIMHSSLKPEHQKQIKSLQKLGWQVIVKDITLDLTPTVMVIGLGPNGKRALTIGSCSAFSLQYAAGKALSEVIRTVLYDEVEGFSLPEVSESNVNDTLTHSHYYANHRNLDAIRWLWEGSNEIEATDLVTHGKRKGKTLAEAFYNTQPEDELKYLLDDVFTSAGIALYSCDMTPQAIKQQAIPLVVVRALAPEMARFVIGYHQEPAETDRFKKLVTTFGSPGTTHNTSLHPFS
jgi:thiazole/oxazole-forming peptide maturase SagD family component